MRANYFWVEWNVNGQRDRQYFSDHCTRIANEFAQRKADETRTNVIRYDLDGGQAWFYASETTKDGYRIYAGS